jgi:hypothetical protein
MMRRESDRWLVRYRRHRWLPWRHHYAEDYDTARAIALALVADGCAAQIRELPDIGWAEWGDAV